MEGLRRDAAGLAKARVRRAHGRRVAIVSYSCRSGVSERMSSGRFKMFTGVY